MARSVATASRPGLFWYLIRSREMEREPVSLFPPAKARRKTPVRKSLWLRGIDPSGATKGGKQAAVVPAARTMTVRDCGIHDIESMWSAKYGHPRHPSLQTKTGSNVITAGKDVASLATSSRKVGDVLRISIRSSSPSVSRLSWP